MQVAGRTKVDDEDGDGGAVGIDSDSGLLGVPSADTQLLATSIQ